MLVVADADAPVSTTDTENVIVNILDLNRKKRLEKERLNLDDDWALVDLERQRQEANFHSETIKQSIETSKLLFEKLKELGALFLFEKLQAKSITLDLLCTLDINELVSNLALNFGESKKLRKVVAALSPENPRNPRASKRKAKSSSAKEVVPQLISAKEVVPQLISDDDSYSSSSSASPPDTVEKARNFLNSMKPRLGVTIDPRLQEATGGVRVAAVMNSSAAALGDLRTNDVVLAVNGSPVNTSKAYIYFYLFTVYLSIAGVNFLI